MGTFPRRNLTILTMMRFALALLFIGLAAAQCSTANTCAECSALTGCGWGGSDTNSDRCLDQTGQAPTDTNECTADDDTFYPEGNGGNIQCPAADDMCNSAATCQDCLASLQCSFCRTGQPECFSSGLGQNGCPAGDYLAAGTAEETCNNVTVTPCSAETSCFDCSINGNGCHWCPDTGVCSLRTDTGVTCASPFEDNINEQCSSASLMALSVAVLMAVVAAVF